MNTLKTVSDLAVILNVSKTSVYRWVKKGLIPHKKLGKLIRFSEDDIKESYDYFIAVQLEAEWPWIKELRNES